MRVFVCLNLPDARLTHGREYFRTALQQMPLSFDILNAKDMTLLQTSPALAQGGTSGGKRSHTTEGGVQPWVLLLIVSGWNVM